MNSKEISRFIGRHPRLRKVGYQLIYLTTLREWYIARAVRQIMSAKPEILSALDAGCGMGQHTYSLARKRPELLIAAIEEDREQVEVLSDFFERCGFGRVRVRAGDITRAELGMPVDLLLCCSVLEHIQDDITLLKRFHAQLRDEGNLVIYVPLAERRVIKSLERKIALMTKTAGYQLPHGHVRYYTPEQLESRLKECGFTVCHRELSYGPCGRVAYDLVTQVQFSRFFMWLFPFYLILIHPFVLALMAIDFLTTKRDGNGLLMVARKVPASYQIEHADAAASC